MSLKRSPAKIANVMRIATMRYETTLLMSAIDKSVEKNNAIEKYFSYFSQEAHPEVVFLVMVGASSFLVGHEVYGTTTENLVPS